MAGGVDPTIRSEAVMTVWRNALRVGAVLACVSATGLVAPAPASAAPGFATELSGLPAEFSAADQVRTLSAVVRRDGGGCVKVRWSMVLSVQGGLRLDQVKMDRVEDSGDFPTEIRTEGDVARLTDRQLDPGTLCPDRTVTARYRVAFAQDVTQGRLTLAAEAYDPRLRLLARQTATREVVGLLAPTSAPPEPTPSAEPAQPSVEPTEEAAEASPTEEAVAEVPPAATASRAASRGGGFGVVQAAFLLGGLLLFLGVGLLLRLRQLTRAADAGGDETARYERRPVRWTAAGR
ncbi:hypothetical protein ACFY3U_24790 [Micromonospora sp. NPDC000089]|uniref:hypothetical protein n=1 Tax=unclassified Micromonospora TaxID=2617518 RepID=UPI0036B3B3EC